MLKSINKLKLLDFSLIEIIIMLLCYGITIYCSLTYWRPSAKCFSVLMIIFVPLLTMIYFYKESYISVYVDVLVLYSMLLSLLMILSVYILKLRHEYLFYTITLSIPLLCIIFLICFTSDICLIKNIRVMLYTIDYSSSYSYFFYILFIIIGFMWSKNVILLLSMVITYIFMKAILFIYMGYYLNVRTKETKNNR